MAALLALVAIGTFEARESARQLADLPNVTRLQPAGAGLTTVGIALSAAVYIALGWWLRDDRLSLRAGATVGAGAGLFGGAIRAALIAEPVGIAVSRFAAVPEWFVPAVLVMFVALSVLVSAIGGAALTFLGVRLTRSSRRRPPA